MKLLRETNSLIFVGISFQILGLKNETAPVLLETEFSIERLKVFRCLKLHPYILSEKPPFMTLYISMARVCRLLICTKVACRCILILDKVRVAYFFYYLKHRYGTSIQEGSSQATNWKSIHQIFSFRLIHVWCHTCQRLEFPASPYTHVFNAISKVAFLSKNTPSSFSFCKFLMATFTTLIPLFSLPLNIKWHLSACNFVSLSLSYYRRNRPGNMSGWPLLHFNLLIGCVLAMLQKTNL